MFETIGIFTCVYITLYSIYKIARAIIDPILLERERRKQKQKEIEQFMSKLQDEDLIREWIDYLEGRK